MLNVALVGLGHIGKLHLEILSSLEEVKAVAIIDTFPVENSLPVFSSIQKCNSAYPEIDLYVIASPNGFHFSQAKEILELKKNVLVEKPIALHKNEVEELLIIAKKNNVRVFSSLQLRYSPVISHVKKLIQENTLGQIYLINVECFWNRNEAYYEKSSWHGTLNTDGGILFTQFSHFLDILFYLTGNLELLHKQTENFSHQSSTEFADSGILQFKSGKTLGSMVYTISTYEKNFESSITLIAENGTLKIGGQYMNQLLYQNVEGLNSSTIECSDIQFHQLLYQDIIQALNKNTSSLADAENTIEMIGFIERVSEN